MEALLRRMDRETIAAAVTDTVVDPLTPEAVAVILAIPSATGESNPVALTAPTFVLEECQVTVVVRICVVPSEYLPVAENCCVWPRGTWASAGPTEIAFNLGTTWFAPGPDAQPVQRMANPAKRIAMILYIISPHVALIGTGTLDLRTTGSKNHLFQRSKSVACIKVIEPDV